MKHCDLLTTYANLASQLPVQTDGNESLMLSSHNLPLPPHKMTTDSLYVSKGSHFYNDWFKVDSLNFFARKETYRYLGLLIFSVVFHRQVSKVVVELNHPHSEIKSLSVEYAHRNIDDLTSGYHTAPFAFKHYPQIAYLHPFNCFNCSIDPKDLPCFNLAHEDLIYTDEDWQMRDTVKIFGSDAGLVLLAELLMNASLPQSEENEFALESESGGYRGVGISSAEAILYLPNHLAWTKEHWQ